MTIIIDPDDYPVPAERSAMSGSVSRRNFDHTGVVRYEGERIASYPIYPSENPDTPYVPQTEAEAYKPQTPDWDSLWHGNSELTSPYEDLTSAEKKVYSDFESLLDKNQTLVFEKTPGFKKHLYADKTYSGVDMVVSISMPGQASYEFDDMQTLSISTHRESFPVRFLGMVNPMGFTSGPRTIAGSMIFTLIEKNPFYKAAEALYSRSGTSPWKESNAGSYPLADSLPPFDITITLNNEYERQGAALRIFGVKIIDEGQTHSIDDLVTEVTYSFMALGIAPVHFPKGWKVDDTSWNSDDGQPGVPTGDTGGAVI